MNRKWLKGGFASVLISTALSAGVSAPAQAIDETRVSGKSEMAQTVTFSRSELTTAEGRSQVERRIREAAEDVCGSSDYRAAGSLSVSAKRKACYQNAVDSAMSQIGANQFATTD